MKQFRAFVATLLFASVALGATQRKIPEGFIAGSSSVGTTAAPNSKSVLDVVSTTKGLLIPRMTTTQRGNISSPAEGLLVWDTDINSLFQYTGSAWVQMSSTSATETLTNKTLTSAELDTALADDGIDFNEEASLSSPAAGKRRLGVKSDGKLYLRNSSGTETEVGSGSGGGGKSYVTAGQGDGETSSTTNWELYCDSAALTPADGTGGTTTSLTFAQTTTAGEVLRQTGSYEFSKNAANRQGCGFSYNFTIERQDQANPKPISINFGYQASANFTYNAGSASDPSDIAVFVYAKDSGVLLYPTVTSLNGSGKFIASFQPLPTDDDYRLIFHVTDTSTSAWDFIVDGDSNNSITIGPMISNQGPPIGDWKSYTPTITNLTTTSVTGQYRRVGDTAEIRVGADPNGTASGAITISLPTDCTIDTNKITAANAFYSTFGTAMAQPLNATPDDYFIGSVVYNNTTTVRVLDTSNTTNDFWGTNSPATWASSGVSFSAEFSVPCSGWGSGILNAAEMDDGRAVFARAGGSTTGITNGGSAQQVTFTSVGTGENDTHSKATTTSYTIPVSGLYEAEMRLTCSAITPGGDTRIFDGYIYVNGVLKWFARQLAASSSSMEYSVYTTGSGILKAGDVLTFYAFHNLGSTCTLNGGSSTSQENFYQIKRIGGNTLPTATDFVGARYTTAAGQALSTSVEATIDFGTKDFDTHNAVTTGASWVFTCPISGTYLVDVMITTQGSTGWAAGEQAGLYIQKSGAGVSNYLMVHTGSTASGEESYTNTEIFKCNQGETIRARGLLSGASISLLASSTHNSISIIRVGN